MPVQTVYLADGSTETLDIPPGSTKEDIARLINRKRASGRGSGRLFSFGTEERKKQLEQELRWMEQNPGKMPPTWGIQGGQPHFASQYDTMFNPGIPMHEAQIQQPINLGALETKKKADGTPDKRYKNKNDKKEE